MGACMMYQPVDLLSILVWVRVGSVIMAFPLDRSGMVVSDRTSR
jgi:hypothetical protein